MASNDNGGKSPSLHPIHHHRHHHCGAAHHHHHHFFYISPHCPLHRPISQPENHSPSCSFHAPPNPAPLHPTAPLDQQSTRVHIAEDEIQNLEDEIEEEADPIFVLTDEWKEFFAKSEAKRRAKKQGKK